MRMSLGSVDWLLILRFGSCRGLFVSAPYWLGLVLAPWLLTRPRPSIRLVGVWWLALSLMTPFYHPYARLWLPCHAINWLLMGWLVANGFALNQAARPLASIDEAGADGRIGSSRSLVVGYSASEPSSGSFRPASGTPRPQPGLLAPSDSLYRASVHVAALLPDEVKGLRLLVRPPVTYYLAGRVELFPMAGSDTLLNGGDPRVWALVDSAILRSELGSPSGGSGRNLLDRFSKNWEVVEEFPTNPSLPTALDLDPGAARSDSADRSSPLWLLRPRPRKTR